MLAQLSSVWDPVTILIAHEVDDGDGRREAGALEDHPGVEAVSMLAMPILRVFSTRES